MKTSAFWVIVLVEVYAIICIYLLLMLFADAEMPLFGFTQMRN